MPFSLLRCHLSQNGFNVEGSGSDKTIEHLLANLHSRFSRGQMLWGSSYAHIGELFRSYSAYIHPQAIVHCIGLLLSNFISRYLLMSFLSGRKSSVRPPSKEMHHTILPDLPLSIPRSLGWHLACSSWIALSERGDCDIVPWG